VLNLKDGPSALPIRRASAKDRLTRASSLFGSPLRTAILVAIRMLEDTYASELAALLDLNLYSVQRVLASLEADGVIAIRPLGRTRVVSLDPRYLGHGPLASLLWELGAHDEALQRALAGRRRRPRRAGKPGL